MEKTWSRQIDKLNSVLTFNKFHSIKEKDLSKIILNKKFDNIYLNLKLFVNNLSKYLVNRKYPKRFYVS